MTEVFYTTLGTAEVRFSKHATHSRLCGINYSKELQVQVWTDTKERAGYIIYHHIPTGRQRYERIEAYYISDWTRKQTGKGYHLTLPIIYTDSVKKEKHAEYFENRIDRVKPINTPSHAH